MKTINGTKYATLEEACEFLNISRGYLHLLMSERRFTSIMDDDNRRKRLIPFRELELKKEGKLRPPKRTITFRQLQDILAMYLTSPESDTDLEALLSSVADERYTKASEIANKVTKSARGNHEISPNGSASQDSLQEAVTV